MTTMPTYRLLAGALVLCAACTPAAESASPPADPLPSWNAGPTKSRIMDFVTRTTTPGDSAFVPAPARIAVFDNDGTLWSEQPLYFELAFSLDRVRALAPAHPEWRQKQPFKGVIEGDRKAVAAAGEKGLVAIVGAAHSGMTTDEFTRIVRGWVDSARHPISHQPYTSMVYQPQLELLAYLRSHGFKTFIVSGGGAEFIRAWSDSIYGIPPEQVVGSRGKLAYKVEGGRPVITKPAGIDLIDDGPGKPVGIAQQIGRRPILAFGNSDGDYEMLEYTTGGEGPRLGLILHHDDAGREVAYDRASHIGHLARALDSAAAKGWVVASMKNDWRTVYPPPR
jgi:phosphoglycolate phosphatase-like HAD superfamily hydrolase